MENLNEKAEAFEKATSTINKKPWAAMILILVAYTVVCYYVIKEQFKEQIEYLTKDNERLNERYDNLTTELLIKNKIIDRKEEKLQKQDELIQYADSTVTAVKEQLNIK